MRVSGCRRYRRTPRLPCTRRALAFAALGGRRCLCRSQGRAALSAEFGLWGILKATLGTAPFKGGPALIAKLQSFGIRKPAAGASHAVSLLPLLLPWQGKEGGDALPQIPILWRIDEGLVTY